jgi:hypothetical protein
MKFLKKNIIFVFYEIKEFVLYFFLIFFEFFKEKSSTFNTGFVSYNVSLQPNIRQKY